MPARARGVPAGREFLLDYDVIEAFCVAGLPGSRPSTRGTYRSALYRLAALVHGEPGQRGTPFAGRQAAAPLLAGRAGRAGRPGSRPARCGQLRLGAGDGGIRHRRRTTVQGAGGAARG
jgi:hypothetical protein